MRAHPLTPPAEDALDKLISSGYRYLNLIKCVTVDGTIG